MTAPFPGMDPYLEGDLWPDVHQALAFKIRSQLVPLIRPNYVARLSRYVVEDDAPESELGIMYPDVEVLANRSKGSVREPAVSYATNGRIDDPAFTIPLQLPVEVQIPVVEIRDTAGNRLVTAIEILSPVNKRAPGLEPYRQKRRRLHQAGVHLLEIDLLRRGTRIIKHPELACYPYLTALTRANRAQTEIWPVAFIDPLPVVPVPLLEPDPDVPLDLQRALSEVYEDAAYQLSIDYSKAPPLPRLSEQDSAWLNAILKRYREQDAVQ